MQLPTHEEWIRLRQNDYGSDVILMLQKGMEVTAVDYINAIKKVRHKIKNAFLKAMTGFDALLVPTTIIATLPFSWTRKQLILTAKEISTYIRH